MINGITSVYFGIKREKEKKERRGKRQLVLWQKNYEKKDIYHCQYSNNRKTQKSPKYLNDIFNPHHNFPI